jgi:hypothetical protein
MEVLSIFYAKNKNGHNKKHAIGKCHLCGKETKGTLTNIKRQKSCGCNKAQIARKNGKTRSTEKTYTNSVLRAYKNSALKRNIDFQLVSEDIETLIKQPCTYCGSLPKEKELKYIRGKQYPRNGIDRIDSSVGYVKGNLTPCCNTCNIMKNTLSTEDFTNHIKKIYEHIC